MCIQLCRSANTNSWRTESEDWSASCYRGSAFPQRYKYPGPKYAFERQRERSPGSCAMAWRKMAPLTLISMSHMRYAALCYYLATLNSALPLQGGMQTNISCMIYNVSWLYWAACLPDPARKSYLPFESLKSLRKAAITAWCRASMWH